MPDLMRVILELLSKGEGLNCFSRYVKLDFSLKIYKSPVAEKLET